MYNTPVNKKEFHRQIAAFENLNSIDQVSVWAYILGLPSLTIEQRICNSLRLDKHPNCWLSPGRAKKGYIVLNDYSRSLFHGFTIFDAVMYKHNCSFNEACNIIEEWIYRGLVNSANASIHSIASQEARKFHFRLLYETNKYKGKDVFTLKDKRYWDQYGISKSQLESDNVKSVRKIIYNTKAQKDMFFKLEPRSVMYAYNFGPRRKTYYPEGKPKFLSTCTSDDIWGEDTLEDAKTIVITKSYKDYRVIKNTGYQCIGLQSETTRLSWDMLLKLEQYPNKLVLFDNDPTGKEQGAFMEEYCNQIGTGYKAIWLEDDNDPADMVKRSSTKELFNFISNF
jgi:hypothetical protein